MLGGGSARRDVTRQGRHIVRSRARRPPGRLWVGIVGAGAPDGGVLGHGPDRADGAHVLSTAGAKMCPNVQPDAPAGRTAGL